MNILVPLFCIWQVGSAVKHSLKYFYTATSGLPDFPEFVGAVMFDGILVGYCDTNNKILQPKQNWVKAFLEKNPEDFKWYTDECFITQPKYFKATIRNFRQRFNQTGGVHILQRMNGCEWDDETDHVSGYIQYAYDGEDFIAFDLTTVTWVAPKPQAVVTKMKWDADKPGLRQSVMFITEVFPMLLKRYVDYGRSFLQTPVLPSVSLLQKTPSSPVSCHATGFYPDRAALLWRRDGEDLHEEVDRGEILPNQDGTFQMSADLNLSPVGPEDWRRLDCVFQLAGVKEDIVTKLDKDKIRTNGAKPRDRTIPIIVAAIAFCLILIYGTRYMYVIIKKKTGPNDRVDQLNPEACVK